MVRSRGSMGGLAQLLLALAVCHVQAVPMMMRRTEEGHAMQGYPGPEQPPPTSPVLSQPLALWLAQQWSARELARLRRVGRAWRATEDALLPITVTELHARAHPLLVQEDPYLLYRFCLAEPERVTHAFPTLERCLDSVDQELGKRMDQLYAPTLAQVRVQVLYDVMRGTSNPPLPRTEEVLHLLLRGAHTDFWTSEQRRAVLFAASWQGRGVRLTSANPDQQQDPPRTILDEVMSMLCPRDGVADPGLRRDCLAAWSLLPTPPAHLLAPHTPEDAEVLATFTQLQEQLCRRMWDVHPSLVDLAVLVQKGANIHKPCPGSAGLRGPVLYNIHRLHAPSLPPHDVVAALAALGADMNERGSEGRLLFHASHAMRYQHDPGRRVALLQGLLTFGADVSATDFDSRSFLRDACSLGLEEELELVLRQGLRLAEYEGHDKLLGAAGSRRTVELLLQHGARLGERSHSGRMALHLAAQSFRPASGRWGLEALLAAGADPLSPDHAGNTPLHLGNDHTLPFLLTAVPPEHRNVRNYRGETPLHLARTRHNLQTLLEAGLDPNALDVEGKSPLYRVVALDVRQVEEKPDVQRDRLLYPVLLARGARIDGEGGRGASALLPALEEGCFRIIQDLLDHDPSANLEARDRFGRSLVEAAPTSEIHALLSERAGRARVLPTMA